MPPAYGVTPAGFVVKPLSAILAGMQAQVLATIDPQFDLSPGTPDGQFLAIHAAEAASKWELLQICFNQFNRQDVEGAGADNLGAVTGTPREGASYTQVYATLSLAAGTYAAGALVASVEGSPAFQFSNVLPITTTGGIGLGPYLFQSTTIGPTASVNAGTLTNMVSNVTGWTGITNPLSQSQAGTDAELDATYLARQAADVAAEGSCTAASCAAALNQLGAAQEPPVTLLCTVQENTSLSTQTINGLVMPPKTFAPIVYDPLGVFAATSAGQAAIAAIVYANKPAGILSTGSTSYTIMDPTLGPQVQQWSLPTTEPLFVSVQVVLRSGFTLSAVAYAILAALVEAAVAPTPTSGLPPTGQLAPGTTVTFGQLFAVIMGVPGVADIQQTAGVFQLFFGLAASPSTQTPISMTATQVATILASTAATNIIVTQGTGP